MKKLKKENPHVRAYLDTSFGKEEFYKKFNFITREEANLGAGMIYKEYE